MTVVISAATFMEILDTSIANVALANISGGLGVSTSQGTWIVTSYLVANAIIIPVSGFLSKAIGRKRYFMISIALFTAASLLCAVSTSLGMLILARVLQGIGGGGLAPVEQSMLADSFPPEKRGQAFAVFGIVVVVAPIIGPTIGGWITNVISWHWIFLINVPVGIFTLFTVGAVVNEPAALVILALAAALTGMSWTLYQTLPSQLTPDEDRGTFFVSVQAPAGSALGLTDAAVAQVEDLIAPYREAGLVTDLIAIVGQYGETGRAFLVATMSPWDTRDKGPREILSELRPAFDRITLASVRSFAPSGLGGGGGSGLDLVVTAPSFDAAADYSEQLAQRLRDNGDIVSVRRDYEVNTPGFDINVNRDLAREIGIDAQAISDAVRTFFASAEVTAFISQDRQYPVILQAPDDRRNATSDLRGINVRAENGALVPLDGLVTLNRRASVAAFNRLDRQPSVEITASLADGVDLGSAIATIERIAQELPPQMQIAYSGQAESFQETSGGIAVTFGLALMVVFLVLAAQFESFIQPVIILLSVPLAVAGALLTLLAVGEAVNIYTQVGMVMLIGLMAKNGILIVEFANQLRDQGYAVREAAIEAATVRLRPILMTVLSTVLGAVPLVLSSGAGAASRVSIGIVIIGGFLAASVLTLFLTPVLYDLLQWDRKADAKTSQRTA